MAKQTLAFQKKISVFYLIFNVFIASIFISCNNNGTDPKAFQVKFAIVKYDVKFIKKWLADTTNKAFIFQFYTRDAKQNDSVWQALSYVVDAKGGYKNGNNPDTLKFAHKDSVRQFTDKLAVGNNVISAKKIDTILNKRPQNVDAVFLVFVPVLNRDNWHVYYKILVETKTMKLNDDGDDTNPCPPINCYDDIE